MKKIIILLTLFSIILFASSSESKIIKLIFNSLYPEQTFSIYATDKKTRELVREARLVLADSCEEATIVYNATEISTCKDKPLFTNKYQRLKENKNAIGAFYWQKGRPNIVFLKSRLEKYNLTLPQVLKKYEVNNL